MGSKHTVPFVEGNLRSQHFQLQQKGCAYPYLNPPACDKTFADHLGRSYDLLQCVYGTAAAGLLILALVQLVRVLIVKGLRTEVDLQKIIVFNMTACALTLVLRAVDPFGWRGWLPPEVSGLAEDVAVALILAVIYSLAFSWVTIINRRLRRDERAHRAYRVFHLVSFVTYVFAGILEHVFDNVSWAFRAFKFSLLVVFLLSASAVTAHYGHTIYSFMRKMYRVSKQEMLDNRSAAASLSQGLLSNSGDSDSQSQSCSSGDLSMSSESGSQRHPTRLDTLARETVERHGQMTKVRRFVLVLLFIVALLVVAYLVAISDNVQHKYDEATVKSAPTVTRMLKRSSLDLLQWMLAIVFLTFFGRMRRRQVREQRLGNSPVGSNKLTQQSLKIARAQAAATAAAEVARLRGHQVVARADSFDESELQPRFTARVVDVNTRPNGANDRSSSPSSSPTSASLIM